jgi:hypothetical protein
MVLPLLGLLPCTSWDQVSSTSIGVSKVSLGSHKDHSTIEAILWHALMLKDIPGTFGFALLQLGIVMDLKHGSSPSIIFPAELWRGTVHFGEELPKHQVFPRYGLALITKTNMLPVSQQERTFPQAVKTHEEKKDCRGERKIKERNQGRESKNQHKHVKFLLRQALLREAEGGEGDDSMFFANEMMKTKFKERLEGGLLATTPSRR